MANDRHDELPALALYSDYYGDEKFKLIRVTIRFTGGKQVHARFRTFGQAATYVRRLRAIGREIPAVEVDHALIEFEKGPERPMTTEQEDLEQQVQNAIVVALAD